ncbi:hypothetical protein BT67DRAFT_390989 [Trichocladium antarcticum]|uniref:Transport protein particle subunit trs85-2 n=1 Tax=Trichocladium antarcticum TaxID=1450529 RepID=A0AAN6UD65_9PEZI|nr:hypothetical protein BT67DRAFT_390989 [Trichocladium antarcticum]
MRHRDHHQPHHQLQQKTRQSLPADSPHHHLSQSDASLPPLPFRTVNDARRVSNPAAASLFRSTLTLNTPPGSPRSASPATGPGGSSSPARSMTLPLTGSIFGGGSIGGGPGGPGGPGGGSGLGKTQSLLDTGAADNPGDPLHLLLRSFVPHVAIHASEDVEGLVREKGFRRGGLWELLRPFGERLPGKVTVRDSNGAARAWGDFAVRFVRFGEGVELPDPVAGGDKANGPPGEKGAGKVDLIAQVETVVERHLSYAEEAYSGAEAEQLEGTPTRPGVDVDATSPYYALYLRRLLSGMPLACHESFAHPVACVMAISSRNPSPIEALQRLYKETCQGEGGLPAWVDGDYLRYYVLVHDEENGDIGKSMALFDQMKRNFGLHCHLLRLRSSQSAETDDDSIPLPPSDWMTASEELADIEGSDTQQDFEDPARYIFESDATAIRTFVREMVTQSVVPTMERNISVWNDQVASRRRGISGRFMSLSKRWAFGSSSRGASGGASSSSSNYDALGFYKADSPEAIMRRLADFAFMLRDWKLAMSTYELLRSDFQNDKAWKYHAAANEMAALALLIMPQNMSSKTRIETINGMIEQAFYSYHARCNSLYGAVRCTVLALELLRLRGGSGIDEAVRWGIRVLDSNLMGPVGDALLKERLAICYASKGGAGSQAWGSRRRKSALWSVLAADAWIVQAKYVQARRCLGEARRMYALLPGECGVQSFGVASDFLAHLNDQLKAGLGADMAGTEGDYMEDGQEQVTSFDDEQTETLDNRRRSRRASLIGPAGGGSASLETAPLHDVKPARLLSEDNGDTYPSQDGFG